MKKHIIITAIGIFGIIVPQTQAALIEITIEAKITAVEDPGNLLEGDINVGDTITGTYKYNSEAVDSEPANPYKGLYKFAQSPYGVFLEVGDFRFETDLSDVEFAVGLINNEPPLGNDTFCIISYNNVMIGSDVPLRTIFWQHDDDSGQAISSINLPVTAPIIDDWQDGNLLNISGGEERGIGFGIGSYVTSAILIPEPTSIMLLTIGCFYVRKRNRKL